MAARASRLFESAGVRAANTLLAIGTTDQRPDDNYASRSELHLFELADGASATLKLRDAGGLAKQASESGVVVQLPAGDREAALYA
ncbi:hypothetical protein C7399_13574 [Paraburkholderia tropica]|uniref:Uncharacterized protein n=1 Tax=Paraburkholderia tropica TaxID=92647 RepID=A0ABX5MD75_9BURK|nr:hypothetical protein C7400_13574 [Paraburkholderia tropica]PZW72205.1 hypothetical protein C7399_13574 [Paraburkholderia tropica]